LDEQTNPGNHIREIIEEKVCKQISILDLANLSSEKQNIYSPRLMLNLCLGYLKLAEIEPNLREFLIQKTCQVSVNYKKRVKSSILQSIIENWLESDSPYENESARIFVKFLSKLSISNLVLLEWITHKTYVYLKCSDILLDYIKERWMEKQADYQENPVEEEQMQMVVDESKEQHQIDSNSKLITQSQVSQGHSQTPHQAPEEEEV
jgi:hypothetical protein